MTQRSLFTLCCRARVAQRLITAGLTPRGVVHLRCLMLVTFMFAGTVQAAFTHNFGGETFGLQFQMVPGATVYFNCGFGGGGAGSNPNDPANPCSENKIWSIEDGLGTPAPDIKPHPGFCDRIAGVPTCGGTGTDLTPYVVEILTDGQGNNFWHQILGDPNSGWAQEVYYKNEGAGASQGGIQSPSGGQGGGTFKSNNATRPLHPNASISGNGTGKPTSIAIRTYLNSNGVEMDFFKSEFDRKPLIQQTVTEPNVIRDEFLMDMRNSDYFTSNVAAQAFILRQYNMAVANPVGGVPDHAFSMSPYATYLTTEPSSGARAYLFDATFTAPPGAPGQPATPSGKVVNVNGGKYTWNGTFGSTGAAYNYLDGGLDIYQEGWLKFWNGSSTWHQGDPYPCNPAIDPTFCAQ